MTNLMNAATTVCQPTAKTNVLNIVYGTYHTYMIILIYCLYITKDRSKLSESQTRRLGTHGNLKASLVVTVPCGIAKDMDLTKGDYIKFSYHREKGHIHLEKFVEQEKVNP